MQPKSLLYKQHCKQPFHSAQMLTSETSGCADCPLTSLKIWYDRLNHKNITNNPFDYHLLHVLKKILSKCLWGFEKLWFNRHFSIFRKQMYLYSVSLNCIPKRGTKTAATASWFQAILYNFSLKKNNYCLKCLSFSLIHTILKKSFASSANAKKNPETKKCQNVHISMTGTCWDHCKLSALL